MRANTFVASWTWLSLCVAPAIWVAHAGNAAGGDPPSRRAPCAGLEPGPTRTVVRILDAETVALDDGSELRLVGALAPRAVDAGADPGRWPLETAAKAELEALTLGKSVGLAFAGKRTDRYGRLQAQAFVGQGEQSLWVQGHLIAQGFARAYALAGYRACAEELLAMERAARESRRGLWEEGAYRVRPAAKLAELSRYLSTFQVVEGRIVRVAQVRGTIHLNFALDWRRAFSVSLGRTDRDLLGAFADDPRRLEGKTVRVRGWIERRGPPTIDLSAAGLIEVLDAAATAADPARGGGEVPRRSRAAQDPPPRQPPEAKPPGLVETGR